MVTKVSIFGVAGYTGAQLVSILINHQNVKIDAVFGEKTIGKKLQDFLPKSMCVPNKEIIDYEEYDFEKSDIVFSCLPHGISQKVLSNIKAKKIIDLSADFRFDSSSIYEKIYNIRHESKKKNLNFFYGIPELSSERIKKSNFISNPGCYPTSILIPMIPILKSDFLKKKLDIFIDSKSGLSGAGKKMTEQNQFMNINQNFFPYNICQHRHQYEIEQEMEKLNSKYSLTFLTQLLPISRGLQSTIFIKSLNIEVDELRKYFVQFYKNSPFVRILDEGEFPEISNVVGTNFITFGVYEDKKNKIIIIISVIDNLIKGASGQAIQNMNLMLGFSETEGLKKINLAP